MLYHPQFNPYQMLLSTMQNKIIFKHIFCDIYIYINNKRKRIISKKDIT